jgi:hypothetical protein
MIAIILHTASEHFNFTPIIANFISPKQEDLWFFVYLEKYKLLM